MLARYATQRCCRPRRRRGGGRRDRRAARGGYGSWPSRPRRPRSCRGRCLWSSSASPTSTSASPRPSPRSPRRTQAGECDLAVAFTYDGTDLGRGEEDLESFVITPLLEDEVRSRCPRPPVRARRIVDLADLPTSCGSRVSTVSRPSAALRAPPASPRRGVRDRGLRGRHGAGRPRSWGRARPGHDPGTAHHDDVVARPTAASRRSIMPSPPTTCCGCRRSSHPRRARRERPGPVEGSDGARPGTRFLDLTRLSGGAAARWRW